MANETIAIGQELLNVPMGEMIHSIATAIADAQFRLDKSSMRVAEFMGGQHLLRDLDTGELLDAKGAVSDEPTIVDSRVYFGYSYDEQGNRVANKVSMMELGYVPTFYQFVDTLIEVKIAIRLNKANTETIKTAGSGPETTAGATTLPRPDQQTVITTTQVDANYTASYNFNAEGASILRTKLVPVPPPAILEERLRALMEQQAPEEIEEAISQGQKLEDREQRSMSSQPLDGSKFVGHLGYYRIGDVETARSLITGAFTVEAWIKPADFKDGNVYIGTPQEDGAMEKGWYLGTANGKFCFALATKATGELMHLSSQSSFPAGEWHHVAGVFDGGKMLLYVNGLLQNATTVQAGDIAYQDTAVFVMGAYTDPNEYPYKEEIDDIRLWKRTLDRAEIKSSMNYRLQGEEPGLVGYWRVDKYENNAVPEVVKQRNAMLQRAVFAEPQGKAFGSAEDIVDCGEVDLKNRSFTIELWARRKTAGAFVAAVFQGKPEKNSGLYVGFRQSDVFMFAFVGNDLDTTDAYPETGEWHHWACVYDQDQGIRVVYRDGVEVARDTPASGYEGTGRLVIGGQYNAAGNYIHRFDGEISEMRVWDAARTQEHINRAKNLHLRGNEEGLVLYRPLEPIFVEVFSAKETLNKDDFDVAEGNAQNITVVEEDDRQVLRVQGAATILIGAHLPFNANTLYRFEIVARQAQEPRTGGKGIYFGGAGYQDETTLPATNGRDTIAGQHYAAVSGDPLPDQWTRYTGYIRGTASAGTYYAHPDPADPGKFHSQVRLFRPIVYVNYQDGDGIAEIASVKVSKLGVNG